MHRVKRQGSALLAHSRGYRLTPSSSAHRVLIENAPNLVQFHVTDMDTSRPKVLLQSASAPRARNGYGSLGTDPSQGQLGRGTSLLLSDRLQGVEELQVIVQIRFRETSRISSHIAFKVFRCSKFAGKEARTQGRECDDLDA